MALVTALTDSGDVARDLAWGTRRPNTVAAFCIGAMRRGIARGPLRKPCRAVLRQVSPYFDVELEGLKWRLWVGDNLTEQRLLERGLHKNRAGLALITDGLGSGDVFVDIGGNCGLFSLFAAKAVGASGRVLAIEPQPEMMRRLRFNAEANGLHQIVFAELAVGGEAGSAALHVKDGQYGLSSLHSAVEGASVTVPVAPLETILRSHELTRVDALKIDIEGFEDRALLPFVKTAPRSLWPKRIFMETTHAKRWETDLVGALEQAGYTTAWRSDRDILLTLP